MQPTGQPVVAAGATLNGRWVYLVAGCLGVGLAAATLSYPLGILLVWILAGPELEPYRLSLPVGVPDVTVTRLVAVGASAVLMLQSIMRSRTFERLIPAEKGMVAFVSLIVLDTLLRSPEAGSQLLKNADSFAIPFLYFYLARNIIRTRQDMSRVLIVIVLGGVVLSLHGSYQFVMHSDAGGAEMAQSAARAGIAT